MFSWLPGDHMVARQQEIGTPLISCNLVFSTYILQTWFAQGLYVRRQVANGWEESNWVLSVDTRLQWPAIDAHILLREGQRMTCNDNCKKTIKETVH